MRSLWNMQSAEDKQEESLAEKLKDLDNEQKEQEGPNPDQQTEAKKRPKSKPRHVPEQKFAQPLKKQIAFKCTQEMYDFFTEMANARGQGVREMLIDACNYCIDRPRFTKFKTGNVKPLRISKS